jgi:hypothetical protein
VSFKINFFDRKQKNKKSTFIYGKPDCHDVGFDPFSRKHFQEKHLGEEEISN